MAIVTLADAEEILNSKRSWTAEECAIVERFYGLVPGERRRRQDGVTVMGDWRTSFDVSRRLKRIRVDEDFGPAGGGELIYDLPLDAVVAGWFRDDTTLDVWILIEHPDFPEVQPYHLIPELTPFWSVLSSEVIADVRRGVEAARDAGGDPVEIFVAAEICRAMVIAAQADRLQGHRLVGDSLAELTITADDSLRRDRWRIRLAGDAKVAP